MRKILCAIGIVLAFSLAAANCNNLKGTDAVTSELCRRMDQLTWMLIEKVEISPAKCNISSSGTNCSVGRTIGAQTRTVTFFNPEMAGSCSGMIVQTGQLTVDYTFLYIEACSEEPEPPND